MKRFLTLLFAHLGAHVLSGQDVFTMHRNWLNVDGYSHHSAAQGANPAVLGDVVGIFAEEDPILILDEKPVGGPGLAPNFAGDGTDLDVDVREAVEEFPEFAEVVAEPAEVRIDENGAHPCLG